MRGPRRMREPGRRVCQTKSQSTMSKHETCQGAEKISSGHRTSSVGTRRSRLAQHGRGRTHTRRQTTPSWFVFDDLRVPRPRGRDRDLERASSSDPPTLIGSTRRMIATAAAPAFGTAASRLGTKRPIREGGVPHGASGLGSAQLAARDAREHNAKARLRSHSSQASSSASAFDDRLAHALAFCRAHGPGNQETGRPAPPSRSRQRHWVRRRAGSGCAPTRRARQVRDDAGRRSRYATCNGGRPEAQTQ
jgi:hypothetical protein